MNQRRREPRKNEKAAVSRPLTAKRRAVKAEKKKGPTATIIPGVTE